MSWETRELEVTLPTEPLAKVISKYQNISKILEAHV